MVKAAERERVLEKLREICLGLPETSERLSHGAPTFFVREKRAFLMVCPITTATAGSPSGARPPRGMQGMLVEANPEPFFVPPYVGHRGWLGVRLDRGLEWDELAGIIEDAWAEWHPQSSSRPHARQGRRREGSATDGDRARTSARGRGVVAC